MNDQKKEECDGCTGLSDEHICQDYADFIAMQAAKDKCQKCETLTERNANLEAALKKIYNFAPINPEYGYQGVDADAMHFIAKKALA